MRFAILALTLGLLVAALPADARPDTPDISPIVDCVAEDPHCGGLAYNPVECLLRPFFPETPVYYIVWYCATGGNIREPIGTIVGCTTSYGEPLRCDGGVVGIVEDYSGCDIGVPNTVCPLGQITDPIACLLGAFYPETPLYYILYGCTVGQVLPEPVDHLTGCRIIFPSTIRCDGSGVLPVPACTVSIRVTDCLR